MPHGDLHLGHSRQRPQGLGVEGKSGWARAAGGEEQEQRGAGRHLGGSTSRTHSRSVVGYFALPTGLAFSAQTRPVALSNSCTWSKPPGTLAARRTYRPAWAAGGGGGAAAPAHRYRQATRAARSDAAAVRLVRMAGLRVAR